MDPTFAHQVADDADGSQASSGKNRLPSALGWWICLGYRGSCIACCRQSGQPTASHDGIGHSLHLSHPGFALQQCRWRLPWSAVVELVADIGQRGPGGLDVVANVQICRVDKLWLSKDRRQEPTYCAALKSYVWRARQVGTRSHDTLPLEYLGQLGFVGALSMSA
jgi:hypothetical protein